jgi:hypothetical protein
MFKRESSGLQDSGDTKRSENLTLLLVLAIALPLLFGWLAWEHGSLLARDFSIGENLENLQESTQYQLAGGSCKSKLVLTWCNLKVRGSSGSEPQEVKLDYMFVDMHSGDYYINLLETRSNPPLLTSDMGQNNLWNRAVTLLALVLFGFCWPFVYFYKRKQQRLNKQQGL